MVTGVLLKQQLKLHCSDKQVRIGLPSAFLSSSWLLTGSMSLSLSGALVL